MSTDPTNCHECGHGIDVHVVSPGIGGRRCMTYEDGWPACDCKLAPSDIARHRIEAAEAAVERARELAMDGIRDGRGQAPELGRALLRALDGSDR